MFDEKVCEGWLLYYFLFGYSMFSKIFHIPDIDLLFSELKYN